MEHNSEPKIPARLEDFNCPVQLWKVKSWSAASCTPRAMAELYMCSAQAATLDWRGDRLQPYLWVASSPPLAYCPMWTSSWIKYEQSNPKVKKLMQKKVCPQFSWGGNYPGNFRYQWFIILQVRSHWIGNKVEEREQQQNPRDSFLISEWGCECSAGKEKRWRLSCYNRNHFCATRNKRLKFVFPEFTILLKC